MKEECECEEENTEPKYPNTKYGKFIKPFNVLHIDRIDVGEEKSAQYQACARILSGYRNMPISFYANTSAGVHGGYFLSISQSIDECIEYAKGDNCGEIENSVYHVIENCGGIDSVGKLVEWKFSVKEALVGLLSEIKNIDPDGEYCGYMVAGINTESAYQRHCSSRPV